MAFKVGDIVDIVQFDADGPELRKRTTTWPGWENTMTEFMKKGNCGWVVTDIREYAGNKIVMIKHPLSGDSRKSWREDWLIHAEENVVTVGQFLKILLKR